MYGLEDEMFFFRWHKTTVVFSFNGKIWGGKKKLKTSNKMANHLTFSLRLGYTYGFADILDRQNPDFRASPNVKTTVGSRNLRQYWLLKLCTLNPVFAPLSICSHKNKTANWTGGYLEILPDDFWNNLSCFRTTTVRTGVIFKDRSWNKLNSKQLLWVSMIFTLQSIVACSSSKHSNGLLYVYIWLYM